MSIYQTVPVIEYLISDDDEGITYADDTTSFDKTDTLLQKLRLENPEITYTMYAEIDA